MRIALLSVSIMLTMALTLTGCPTQTAQQDMPPLEDPDMPAGVADPDAAEAITTVLAAVPCGVAGPYGDICSMLEDAGTQTKMEADIAGTTVLTRKIVDGKSTCDAYLAMGDVEVETLKEAGKVAKAVPIAGIGLGLIVAKGNPLGIESIADLAHDDVKAVAIAQPNSSVGFHAQQALENAGVWDAVEPKAARPDSPADLKKYVTKGQADAAIIYHTCLVEVHKPGQEKGQGVSTKLQDVGVVDQSLYDTFHLYVVVPKDAGNPAGADEFIDACLSDEGQKILQDWHYLPIADAGESSEG